MKEKELEKLLKGFRRVKAPDELDERLAPYFEKRRRWYLIPAYALLLGAILWVILGIWRRKKTSFYLYEPLYAAYTVLGYYEIKKTIEKDANIRVLLDGDVLVDSFYFAGDTLKLSLELSSGLHYIIIETYNEDGNLQSMKTVDLYSL